MQRQEIAFSQITPSKLNPRRDFDEAALAGLADSIAEHGVMQNLVLRKAGKNYEIAAGERRYRAFKLLVDQGRRKPADTLPALVTEADDVAAIRIALAENLDREDLSPLDEAAGYADLVQLGQTVAQIAAKSTRTRRHIELRLDLHNKLGAEAKAAMRAGKLSLAFGRKLAQYANKAQQKNWVAALADGKHYWVRTADDLEEVLMRDQIPASAAIFDLGEHADIVKADGEVFVEPEQPRAQAPEPKASPLPGGTPPLAPEADKPAAAKPAPAPKVAANAVITDPAKFAKLQAEAIKAKKAELEGQFSKVTIVDGLDHLPHWEKGKGNDDWRHSKAQDAEAVIFVTKDMRVRVHGQVKPVDHEADKAKAKAERRAKAKADKAAKAEAPFNPHDCLPREKGLADASNNKSRALQAAIMKDGGPVAKILAVMGMLQGSVLMAQPPFDNLRFYGFDDILIKQGNDLKAPRDKFTCPGMPSTAERMARTLAPAINKNDRAVAIDGVKVFDILSEMSALDIDTLFSMLVAESVGTWASHRAELGDSDLVVHLAKQLGVKDAAAGGKRIDLEMLDGLGLEGLRALARQIGMTREYIAEPKLRKARLGDLKAAILDYVENNAEAALVMPPAYTFGAADSLVKLYPEPPKVAAEPKPAAKAKAPAKAKAATKGKGKAADVGKSTAKGKTVAKGGLKVGKEITAAEAEANQAAKAKAQGGAAKSQAGGKTATKKAASGRFAATAKG